MKPAPPVIKIFFASSNGGNLVVPVRTGASLQIPVSCNCRATSFGSLHGDDDDEDREEDSPERRWKTPIPKNDLRVWLHEPTVFRTGSPCKNSMINYPDSVESPAECFGCFFPRETNLTDNCKRRVLGTMRGCGGRGVSRRIEKQKRPSYVTDGYGQKGGGGGGGGFAIKYRDIGGIKRREDQDKEKGGEERFLSPPPFGGGLSHCYAELAKPGEQNARATPGLTG